RHRAGLVGTSERSLEPRAPLHPIRRPGSATPDELLFFEELCETLKDITVRDDELGFAPAASRDRCDAGRWLPVRAPGRRDDGWPERAAVDAHTIIAHKAHAQYTARRHLAAWYRCDQFGQLAVPRRNGLRIRVG